MQSQTRAIDRRAAMMGTATLSTAAVLAVLGAAIPRGAKAGQPTAQDVSLLNAAIALEHEGIAAYQLGADSGLLTPKVLATAITFQGHHKQHRDDLAAAVRRLGGRPVPSRELSVYARALGVASLKDQAGILRLALKLERGAANAYLGLIPSLEHTEFHLLAARMAGDEAFHAALLANVLGEQIPPKAPLFG